MNTETTPVKKWYASKAIWGSITVIISLVAGSLGFDIPKEELNGITDQIFNLVPEVLTLVGSLVAVYGRIKAEHKVA